MSKPFTRDDAIAIVLNRAGHLQAKEIRHLVTQLPVGIKEAINDFTIAVALTPAECELLIKHNVSIAWELLEFAKEKELYGPNFKVGRPPRIN